MVSVCGKAFLLGATKAGVTMLSELPPELLNTPENSAVKISYGNSGNSGTGETANTPPTFAEALAANLAAYLPKRKNKPVRS